MWRGHPRHIYISPLIDVILKPARAKDRAWSDSLVVRARSLASLRDDVVFGLLVTTEVFSPGQTRARAPAPDLQLKTKRAGLAPGSGN